MAAGEGSVIALALPYPPSANALWRNVGGKTLVSAPYRKWKALAFSEIAEQGAGRLHRKTVTGPYQMALMADRPDRRRRDLGNLEKAASDALVASGVVADDCDATKISLAWSTRAPGKGAKVWITIEGEA